MPTRLFILPDFSSSSPSSPVFRCMKWTQLTCLSVILVKESLFINAVEILKVRVLSVGYLHKGRPQRSFLGSVLFITSAIYRRCVSLPASPAFNWHTSPTPTPEPWHWPPPARLARSLPSSPCLNSTFSRSHLDPPTWNHNCHFFFPHHLHKVWFMSIILKFHRNAWQLFYNTLLINNNW